ncbi:inositol monophosphatase family protein [Meridianimarinicoccus sp. RP-17]|uniref:inositol monophosphatase family protein n=1 Tax=Meridianimarinicoccus zhengii TaxID=2056810 RepID=UPI000DAE5D1D|nr:inositol monophosphatase family protein [Phycocomes zhengii]
MTDPVRARHELACDIAREAGAAALAMFNDRDALIVEAKANPQDVVSRADREVETLVRTRIAAAFPDDGIMGEEHAPTQGRSGFTWVIDPIDGTMPFLSDLPHWCVAIALVQDDDTVAAATYVPVPDLLFDALRGGGFRCNGVARHIPADMALTGAMTAIGASHRTPSHEIAALIHRLLDAGGVFYRNGSGAMMLADVAMGRLAGYYEPHMNAWDCLGGILMVAEAGGRTAPFDMQAMLTGGGSVLAAAPAAFAPLARIAESAGTRSGV